MTSTLESKPRFNGCPLVCEFENLPAFKDEAELNKFHNDNGCSSAIIEKWKCLKCDCWHYLAEAPAPSGMSSGSQREHCKLTPQYRKVKNGTE